MVVVTIFCIIGSGNPYHIEYKTTIVFVRFKFISPNAVNPRVLLIFNKPILDGCKRTEMFRVTMQIDDIDISPKTYDWTLSTAPIINYNGLNERLQTRPFLFFNKRRDIEIIPFRNLCANHQNRVVL